MSACHDIMRVHACGVVQFQGNSSSIRLIGCPLPMRSRTSVSHACGLMTLSL